ncbi:MAG TPA: hypothetical protein VK324_06765 [Tepidisphaeraceae bacterium]|nr:hypothetical protein [Tepidisphaeraceae bacterium]
MLPNVVRRPNLAEDVALGARLAHMQGREIGPEQVARVLREAGVAYVLVGAHAANGYTGRPRATVDVDVVVQFPKKAAQAIAAAYPYLVATDTPVVTRFKDGEHEAIDLMKPSSSKLWGRLLKLTRGVKIGTEEVRVPVLEGVLAAKFAAMVSLGRRQADKMIDCGDFIRMVEANEQVDLTLLAELGDLVFAGGGEEVVRHVNEVRAGRPLRV